MKRKSLIASVLFVAACATGPGAAPAQQAEVSADVRAAMAVRFDFDRPYLGGPLPGGERLIHPMPEAGSLRLAEDEEANRRALSLRESPRWLLAARDANLGKGWYGNAFSCAAGHRIDEVATPAIAHLVRRAASDFGSSTSAVKKLFMRQRPFMVNGQASCTPDDEVYLRDNGSYPSGHSAVGYGTSLVLASLFPEQGAALVARGRAYGNSRWVCNVHWLSDVEEGRTFAAATFARLQSSPEYQEDYAAAKAEAAALADTPDAASCAAEAATLGG